MKQLRKIKKFLRYGFPLIRPSLPMLTILNITTRCNLACRHCNDDVWGDPQKDLSLEEIAKFSASLGTIESLALGGGEPFLHRDLREICRLFVSNNQVSTISIPTNGLEPEIICSTAGSILAAHPELALNIMLSLDGFQETHDFIRKEGSFTKVLESARKLKELSKCFPRLSLSFSCTINNHNWQELPELAKFIRDTFQAKLDFTILSGHPRDSAFVAPLREELAETLDGLLSISQNSPLQRLRNKIYRDTLLKANFESRQVVPCRAGSLVGLIYANGDVHACPRLATLGNIRSKNFRDIWHGQQALEQFRTISLGTCNCNDDCFIRVSLTNYWKLPFFMLRNLVGL